MLRFPHECSRRPPHDDDSDRTGTDLPAGGASGAGGGARIHLPDRTGHDLVRGARENALAFAVELGEESAIHEDLGEYMSMLFYSPEVRDAFPARAPSFAYSQKVIVARMRRVLGR